MKTNLWSRTDLLDCLEVTTNATRSWTFYWPARMVIVPTSDGLSWTPRGERMPVPLGSVLVAPAGATHLRIEAPEGATFRVLFEHPRSSSPSTFGPLLLPQLWALPEAFTDIDELFLAAIRHLEGTAPVAFRVAPFVTRTRRSLAETLTVDLDLETLGVLAGGVERCHLCRTFQKATGLPPYRFRGHLRIARARELLAAGHECTKVAHAVGFCDQSHLTRYFKELTGTTPSAYARSCRQSSMELAA